MNISKSIIVKAIQTADNELIPIWDSRITFENSEYYGNILHVEGHRNYFSSLKDCVFDLETKKLSFSEEVEIYPSSTEYSVGETVYYDRRDGLEETKVLNIIYEDFEIEIVKGCDIGSCTRQDFVKNNVEINNGLTYTIKRWKPIYVLENGKQTQWSHQLHKKNIKKNNGK